jgi:hypothetical protein
VDHTDDEGSEVERDDALDQSPVGQLRLIVKKLANQLNEPEALRSDEIAEFRQLLEERRRQRWLWRRIGVFFIGIPSAAVAIWQLAKGLIEWIKSQ